MWTARHLREALFLVPDSGNGTSDFFCLAYPVLLSATQPPMTFIIILQLLYTPLLTIEKGPPGWFCFPAMEADKVGHELPSFCVWRLWVCNERRFERCLRTLPFFTLDLSPIVL